MLNHPLSQNLYALVGMAKIKDTHLKIDFKNGSSFKCTIDGADSISIQYTKQKTYGASAIRTRDLSITGPQCYHRAIAACCEKV